MPWMEKRIKSGPMLEIERYPVGPKGKRLPPRPKEKPTAAAQQNLNDKNAKKKLVRMVNTNFTRNDLHITLSYAGVPPAVQEALRDRTNYINRIKRWRKRHALPEIKWIAVTEISPGGRVHHHIIMSAMDRDAAEELWGKGRANAMRLQPDEFGLEGIARYIVKGQHSNKRWSGSRNLEIPTVTTKLLKGRPNIFRQFRAPKGYTVLEIENTDSLWAGPYQYITLRKTG